MASAREVIMAVLLEMPVGPAGKAADTILAALEAEGLVVRSADEVDACIAEAVAGERRRISDWAQEIAHLHDREAKRLGLILNGKHRFAARKFRQFAATLTPPPRRR